MHRLSFQLSAHSLSRTEVGTKNLKWDTKFIRTTASQASAASLSTDKSSRCIPHADIDTIDDASEISAASNASQGRRRRSTGEYKRSKIFETMKTDKNTPQTTVDSVPEWVSQDRLPVGFWNDMKNQRRFFDWAAHLYGIQKHSDWYTVNVDDFLKKTGAGSLLRSKYNSSMAAACRAVYPEHQWHEWLFSKVSKGFWKDATNIRRYLDWLAPVIGVRKMEDWYSVGISQLVSNHGDHLVATTRKSNPEGGTMVSILRLAFPEHEWLDWKCVSQHHNVWADPEACRQMLHRIQEKMGWSSMEDWYRISNKIIEENNGLSMLIYHDQSAQKVLRFAFPDHDWLPWKFQNRSKNVFSDLNVLKQFMDWISKQLDISDFSGWYRVTSKDVRKVGGKAEIWGRKKLYKTLPEVLRAVYPHHTWLEWKFASVPPAWWADPSNQRRYLDSVYSGLFPNQGNKVNLADWYGITTEHFVRTGSGSLLMRYYKGSLPHTLKSVYPEHEWHWWKFRQVSARYWSVKENQREFVDWVARQVPDFDPSKPSTWIALDAEKMKELGGATLLEQFGSVEKLMENLYQATSWKY
eukprot:TRINITY_DN15281_c0_g1_i1.p1 TRINITY_DN15281_c0_g1~~TRINITY_DN15281_c0_g1_i1.p1  ORF type:complete len:579 (-),score=58.97 TRINITY_DN15281_c0_g1_i1:528-2264(-)